MYGTKDIFKIDSHSSQPFQKPVRMSIAPRYFSRRTSSPPGAFSDNPSKHLSPVNKDLSGLKHTTRSGLDEDGAPEPLITSDENAAKEMNHSIPLEDAGAAAATRLTSTGPWEASKLRHRIRALEYDAKELATRRREAVNEDEKRHLQMMTLSLKIKIKEGRKLLRECEARISQEHGSGDGRYGRASPYTTQANQEFQMPRSVSEQFSGQRPPMDSSRSTRMQVQPEPQDSPEDEWTDIKLEEAVVPLGQEEWDDDIAPELAPTAASSNPQYPRVARNSVSEMLRWRRY